MQKLTDIVNSSTIKTIGRVIDYGVQYAALGAVAALMFLAPGCASAQIVDNSEPRKPKVSTDSEFESASQEGPYTFTQKVKIDFDGNGIKTVLRGVDSESDRYTAAVRAFFDRPIAEGFLSLNTQTSDGMEGFALDSDVVLGSGEVKPIVGGVWGVRGEDWQADTYAGARIGNTNATLGLDLKNVSDEAVQRIHGELDMGIDLSSFGEGRVGNLILAGSRDSNGKDFGALGFNLSSEGQGGFRTYVRTDFDKQTKYSFIFGDSMGSGALRAILSRQGDFVQGLNALLGVDTTDAPGKFTQGRISSKGLLALDLSYVANKSIPDAITGEVALYPYRFLERSGVVGEGDSMFERLLHDSFLQLGGSLSDGLVSGRHIDFGIDTALSENTSIYGFFSRNEDGTFYLYGGAYLDW